MYGTTIYRKQTFNLRHTRTEKGTNQQSGLADYNVTLNTSM